MIQPRSSVTSHSVNGDSVALNSYVATDAPQQTRGTQQSPLAQKRRQNTSYLQLGGINNNRLYAIMTIFAQGFNICSSKF